MGEQSRATRRRSRAAVASAATLLALVPQGCVTPILLTERHAAVGLWTYRARVLDAGVFSERVEGVGVGVIDGAVIAGYAHRHTVTVDPAERGFRFSTPWVEAAGGPQVAAFEVQRLLPPDGAGHTRSVP